MKNKILIFLILFTTELASCQNNFDMTKIKDEDFRRYLSLFKEAKLPFSTCGEMINCSEIINDSLVRNFICKDRKCLKDWSGYDIEFWACYILPSSGDYIIVMYAESGAEGGSLAKIVTYDYSGNKLGELEILADKTYHGKSKQNEITSYEIESIITQDYVIEKKYFGTEPGWTEGKEFFYYGTHIEYRYKIESSGKIILLEEKNFGRKIYKGERLKTNTFPPYMLAE